MLTYLNSIYDPVADYYVCNVCNTETEVTPIVIDSDLIRDDLENMFQTITADMKSYATLNSNKQYDYANVFTDEQSLMEQRLDEANKTSNGQPDSQLIKKLNLYATLVYDAYSQKALLLAPNISKYDQANYESQTFTSITDAMTIHNEIALIELFCMCNKISICRSQGGISLRKNFSADHQVTTYLRKTYGAGKMFNLGLGSISAREDLTLKNRLIKQESYQTLASIHSGIEAKYEFMKQLGLILTIFIFSLTTMIGSLTLYVQQSMKNYDWTHEAIMLDVKAQADLLESREWLKDPVDLYNAKNKLYAENLSEQKFSYNNELTKYFNNYYYALVSFIILVLLIVSPIGLRYMWISSIHFCIKEAYKQKEKIENQTS